MTAKLVCGNRLVLGGPSAGFELLYGQRLKPVLQISEEKKEI
jgi:hypothetical protein